MPNPNTFIHEYGFTVGNNYSGYTLENIESTHNPVIKYRKYTYTFKLTFRRNNTVGQISAETLYNSLNFGAKVINSDYENPYHCSLTKIDYQTTSDMLTISLSGLSVRV